MLVYIDTKYMPGFLHARLLEKVVSYLVAKFNKMAYFGVEFKCQKHTKS